MWSFAASFVLASSWLGHCAAQTFAGFKPATDTTLFLKWNSTVLTYSGQTLGVKDVLQLPTLGVASCTGTYLLVMVDPDAPGGSNATQVALHTIHGNYTCGTTTDKLNGTTYHVLQSDSQPLAPFVAPEPQPGKIATVHHYTLLLFRQPTNFHIASEFTYALPLNLKNPANRLNFNIQKFAEVLASPLVAGNTFDIVSPATNSTSGSGSASSSASAGVSASASAGASPSTVISAAFSSAAPALHLLVAISVLVYGLVGLL